MKDYLVRGISNKHNCRAFACATTNLTNVARKHHDLWPCASAALGRVMAATLMMGAMNKDREKLTVTINGGGPIGTILATTNSDGNVKAFVANPQVHYTYNDTGKLAVGLCVGTNGTLQVIRDMGLKEPMVSNVPLQTGEIGDDLVYYFMVSEQVPSIVSLGVLVDDDNVVLAAGGFIIQLLPEATEEDITYLEDKMRDFPAVSTLINEGKTPEDILAMVFDDIDILDHMDLSFKCDCSKERMRAAIMTVATEDIEAMADEEHGAELTCQFCNAKYYFTEDELREIIAAKQDRRNWNQR